MILKMWFDAIVRADAVQAQQKRSAEVLYVRVD